MRCKVCASDVNVLACVSWHGHGSSFCTAKKNGLVPTVFTMLKNILHPGLCHPSYTFQVPLQIWHEAFSGFLNPIFSVMPQDDKTVGCLGAPMPNWWLWLWLVSYRPWATDEIKFHARTMSTGGPCWGTHVCSNNSFFLDYFRKITSAGNPFDWGRKNQICLKP